MTRRRKKKGLVCVKVAETGNGPHSLGRKKAKSFIYIWRGKKKKKRNDTSKGGQHEIKLRLCKGHWAPNSIYLCGFLSLTTYHLFFTLLSKVGINVMTY